MDAIKAEQEAHHEEINKLCEDSNSKDLHLKTLYSGIDDLREMKADKDFVALEMEEKADKRLVDYKANRVFVDNHFEKLNDGLQAALQRCQGQEEALKNAIHQISNDVDGKLDRMELQSVKDFLENRLSKLKNAAPTAPPPRQDDSDAAGMRRLVDYVNTLHVLLVKPISCASILSNTSDPIRFYSVLCGVLRFLLFN